MGNLFLTYDRLNCRLELYDNKQNKQLLDMPLNENTMVIDVGREEVLLKYLDTTRKFSSLNMPVTTVVVSEGESEPIDFDDFYDFYNWLRNIRNSCQ